VVAASRVKSKLGSFLVRNLYFSVAAAAGVRPRVGTNRTSAASPIYLTKAIHDQTSYRACSGRTLDVSIVKPPRLVEAVLERERIVQNFASHIMIM